MVKEFWAEILTKESWNKLVQLSKEFDFILIGGWAAYLFTDTHKSKDIDILIDYKTLSELSEKYTVTKNERLKKYEIKLEKFDIDIYLPYFSKLTLPIEDIQKNYVSIVKGIKTTEPEVLLILKQGAEIARRNSIKGKKDSIDILVLLIYADLELKKYKQLLEKYNLESYLEELIHVIKNFSSNDIDYLGLSFKKYSDWKKIVLEKLKKL